MQIPTPQATAQWVNAQGQPTPLALQFFAALATGKLGPLAAAPNDITAAKAGVAIGQFYQANGIVRVRLT